MRSRMFLAITALTLVAAACSGGGADVAVGSEVLGAFSTNPEGVTVSPDFELTTPDGGTWTLSEQQKPTIVLFLADW